MQDESLRGMVDDPEELSLLQKYSIIRQFMNDDNNSQAQTQNVN